jgi:hypothetical protein
MLAAAERLFEAGQGENSLLRSEFAGNSAICGTIRIEKAFDFRALAAKFPKRRRREFFRPEQGMCREFFAAQGFSERPKVPAALSPRDSDRPS